VVYGKHSPSVLSYLLGVSKFLEVDITLIVQDNILRTLKDNLFKYHNQIKQQAYQCHSEHHFVEGVQVFLHLQPYKKTSLKVDQC